LPVEIGGVTDRRQHERDRQPRHEALLHFRPPFWNPHADITCSSRRTPKHESYHNRRIFGACIKSEAWRLRRGGLNPPAGISAAGRILPVWSILVVLGNAHDE